MSLTFKGGKQLKNRGKSGGSRFITSSRSPSTPTHKTTNPKVDTSIDTTINPPTPSIHHCFKCKGVGHIARDFPNKQLVTLVEESVNVYNTEEKAESDESEIEVVYADLGDVLITQRVLNIEVSKTVDDSSWL